MSGLELLKGLNKHRHIYYLGPDYLTVIWDDGRSASLRVVRGGVPGKRIPGITLWFIRENGSGQ
jgi:hypothetical protein